MSGTFEMPDTTCLLRSAFIAHPLHSQPRPIFALMYTRQEASKIRQEFWTAFGQYMQPVLSAGGEKINWVNYRTGEPQLGFRMNAGRHGVSIAIELSHPDAGVQELYFDQLEALKPMFRAAMEEDWHWERLRRNEQGKTVSRIYRELPGVNVFNREDWPAMISFLKQRIIRLDAFWSEVRYAFDGLR